VTFSNVQQFKEVLQTFCYIWFVMQYLAFIFSIKKMAHDTNKTYERPEVFQLMQPIHKTNNTKPLLHKENNNSMIGCFRFNI
jgi:hypothetical protein